MAVQPTFRNPKTGFVVTGPILFQGAQPLTAQSSLCEITCTDGCKYVMLCGMKGQLLEINDNLKSNPHLVTEKVFLHAVFYFISSPECELLVYTCICLSSFHLSSIFSNNFSSDAIRFIYFIFHI